MSSRDTKIYRRDAAASGALLNVEEREALVRKYLPSPDIDGDEDGSKASAASTKPTSSNAAARAGKPRRKPIRTFLKTQLYLFVFGLIQLFFGIYIRLRRFWRILKALVLRVLYHHHRTPELIENDVAGLSRLPKHLSVLLELPEEGREASKSARRAMRKRMRSRQNKRRQQKERKLKALGGKSRGRERREKQLEREEEDYDEIASNGIEGLGYTVELEALLDDMAEIAAWSCAAGIPVLSIYERRGVLKEMIPGVHAAVHARLTAYFGKARCPTLQVRAPHVPSYLNGDNEDDDTGLKSDDGSGVADRVPQDAPSTSGKHFQFDSNPTSGAEDEEEEEDGRDNNQDEPAESRRHLDLLLLSEDDGRATMVDLTKTLAEMSQKGRLSPRRDIGLELIERELAESYAAHDPDLLMLFGDRVVLRGYPPWQLRLTEIFCAGDGSGGSVDYPTWLRGLYRFAKAEMRLGR